MIIKYIIWNYKEGKPKNRKNMITNIGEIEFPCAWEQGEDHEHLRKAILKKHPTWRIASYCLVEDYETMRQQMNNDNPDFAF